MKASIALLAIIISFGTARATGGCIIKKIQCGSWGGCCGGLHCEVSSQIMTGLTRHVSLSYGMSGCGGHTKLYSNGVYTCYQHANMTINSSILNPNLSESGSASYNTGPYRVPKQKASLVHKICEKVMGKSRLF